MSNDYIPESAENLHPSCVNLSTQVAAIHPADVPAMTSTKAAKLTDALTRLGDKARAVVEARIALRAAETALKEQREADMPLIHEEVADLKRMDGVTPEMISAMDITAHQPAFNPSTYRPTLKAEVHAGHVFLSAPKRGVKAMNYYMRRRGAGAWTLIAANRTKSPVRDDSPLAVPGVAEWREYQCTGVISDQEVGQPSAILEVLYGG